MRNQWVEKAANRRAGLARATRGERTRSTMWFAYKNEPYLYLSGVTFPPYEEFVVIDKDILDYAHTLWELGK